MKTRGHILVAFVIMLACVTYFLWREHQTAGAFGFPIDDAWIHAQFARNIALGHGFSYSPGVPASGSTAPLWTIVSAGGYLLTGNPVVYAKVLGVIFFGVAVWLVYMLVRTITSDARKALFAAVMTASLPRLIWASVSGMEITLALTLSLAGILAHILHGDARGGRQYLSTVLFGLAALVRPECAVFFAAAMIDRALASVLVRWREVAARDWLIPVVIHVAIFLVIVTPFALFSKKVGVGFLPNTAYAKALQWNRGLLAAFATGSVREAVKSFTVHPCDYFLSFLGESLRNNPVLFAFAALGFLRLTLSTPYSAGSRCRSFILPLSVVLFPLAVGVAVPFGTASYQEGRYVAPVAPLMLIVGTVGMYAAARYGARALSEAKFLGRPAKIVLERSLVWLFMVLALSVQARSVWHRGKTHALEVDNITDMQVALGRWIDQNLPDDAVLAANDIGAIAYFSERRVIDTCGLVSPAILAHWRRSRSFDSAVFSLLEEQRPGYAVLFPGRYPECLSRTSVFRPIYSVELEENIICAEDEMVVYRLDWDELASTDAAGGNP